ncbi:GTP 3',8-cyclase MoaA [Endozoicomonadaceae bacterium StTr2]
MERLQDTLGRTFPYLRLSVTDLCNFRCSYCLPEGCFDHHHNNALSINEIRRLTLAFAAVGTQKVRLTGGEPTLRKDFLDIVSTVKQVPGIKKVAMTTNGYKISQCITQWKDAGIDSVNISIDSLDPKAFELITGHNRLKDILKGIETGLASGLSKIKVNAVLMKGLNDESLDSFINWVSDKPVSLRFIELMQTGSNTRFFNDHHVSGMKIYDGLINRGWKTLPREIDAGPAQEFYHDDYRGRIGLIMPYAPDFCHNCNRLRVTSQGQLQLCLFASSGIELRDLLQSDDQHEELVIRMRESLKLKEASHFLDQGITGMTRNLAQVGG